MQLEQQAPTEEPSASAASAEEALLAARRPVFRMMLLSGIGVTLIVVVGALIRDHGHLVYVLDDAAIHMSMAKQFAAHGTWGVTSGVYESASSSPGWTLILSAFTFVARPLLNVWPLVLNVVAAVWLIWLFASEQAFLASVRRHWAGVALILFLPIVVLYVPALAMVGMEHTLHTALVVEILVLLARLQRGPLTLRNARLYLAMLLIATSIRYETTFLAVGCAAALIVAALPMLRDRIAPDWTLRSAVGMAVLTGVASGLPVLVYGVVNKYLGQDFLPNSIVAKSVANQGVGIVPNINSTLEHIQGHGVIAVLELIALTYVVVALMGGPRRNLLIAIAYFVLVLLHAGYGDFGFYERYQAYLIIAGMFVALRIGAEVVPHRWAPAAALVSLVALLGLMTVQTGLVVDVPLSSNNTYEQRYQLGRFFAKYYSGRAVATGELGYVSLFHKGPIVDVLGLGSHDVATVLKQRGGRLNSKELAHFIRVHHVAAIGVYPTTVGFNAPSAWYLAAQWKLNEKNVTGFDKVMQFYGPNATLGAELERKLHAFQPQLPNGVTVTYHDALLRQLLKRLAGA